MSSPLSPIITFLKSVNIKTSGFVVAIIASALIAVLSTYKLISGKQFTQDSNGEIVVSNNELWVGLLSSIVALWIPSPLNLNSANELSSLVNQITTPTAAPSPTLPNITPNTPVSTATTAV
jgi:hypothetical protein